MKQTKLIMGMPITIEIIGETDDRLLADIFNYFTDVDNRYSTYKKESEISQINRGLPPKQWSQEVTRVLQLCEETKQRTQGYFDIAHNGRLDPSGLVKGWAINNAAEQLRHRAVTNFYIEAGGDIQVHGTNAGGQPWRVGIRNPFNINEVIKTVAVSTEGVATSGTYVRGQHIYNPRQGNEIHDVKSLTVIA